jgi:hypothetical protein
VGHVANGLVYGYDNVEVLAPAQGTDGRRKRLHVVRRINPPQAAVVRQIFTLYVTGLGLTRLAKRLNAEHVPPPRGGTRGWAPTAIREMLGRELYHGVVLWNRTQKIHRGGTQRQRRRPESEWLRLEAPELRIIPEDLWRAAQNRRARARQRFARTPGGTLLRRPSCEDFESPYLLSGLARCARCGGALVAMTRSHGSTRATFYGCAYHHKRGRTICANGLQIRQEILDRAVLDAHVTVLTPRLIEDAVTEACVRIQREADQGLDRRTRIDQERSEVDARIRHLVDAVKRGLGTDALLHELQAEEARKETLVRQRSGLDALARVGSLDARRVAGDLAAIARNVKRVLTTHVSQARQMVRQLLEGRIECEPFEEPDGSRGYRFEATGTYGRLLPTALRCNDGGGSISESAAQSSAILVDLSPRTLNASP